MTAMQVVRKLAERSPWLKSALKMLARPFRADVSAGYVELGSQERQSLTRTLAGAWKSEDIPARQRAGVDQTLMAYRAGSPVRQFDVLKDMLEPLARAPAGDPGALSLLEVGCSSGYYSEALAIKGIQCDYSGCDYSPAFIDMARRLYPALDFRVEDATAMRYADASFDVVVSGCCLLHIPDYDAAISEASRVARDHVVFHRTPVLHQGPTTYFTKLAYGVKTVEIHFNEQELVSLFAKHALYVVGIYTLDAAWRRGDAYATKSYLCRKITGQTVLSASKAGIPVETF